MGFSDRKELLSEARCLLERALPVKLGTNKSHELERLLLETASVRRLSCGEVLDLIGLDGLLCGDKGGIFCRVKRSLMEIRYPSGARPVKLMPVKILGSDRPGEAWHDRFEPERIFIEKAARDHEWTASFTARFPDAEKVIVDGAKEACAKALCTGRLEKYTSRRSNVLVTEQRSRFVRRCPCSEGCLMCGYWILHMGFGCPLDCAYCFLQTYSNFPGIILPANIERLFDETRRFDLCAKAPLRIGTGEFTDSLALERYTGHASMLIEHFRTLRNITLELKTKVADIDSVLDKEPHERVVLSWSLNTPRMADMYELGSPSPEDRLEAARRAAEAGYAVAFHLDPIIRYSSWREEYSSLVDDIFGLDAVRKKLRWISLGTLRYTTGLKQLAERRFEHMDAFYEGEFLEGADGKFRYPLSERVEMYDHIYRRIREHAPQLWVYLCMESREAWDASVLDPGKESRYNVF